MAFYSPILTVMLQATQKASQSIARDYGEVEQLQVSQKGTYEFVTATKQRIEIAIIKHLRSKRPDIGIVVEGEEKVKGSETQFRFLLNALDGFNNFMHALPLCCISLALEKHTPQGIETIAAIIDLPCTRETFLAERGRGAWSEYYGTGNVNRNRLRVSSRRALRESMTILVDFPANENPQTLLKLAEEGTKMRFIGSSSLALAYVAAGKSDFMFQHHHTPANLAAGILMVLEAGGRVTTIQGNKTTGKEGDILASNGVLHDVVAKKLIVERA